MSLLHKIAIGNAKENMSWTLSLQKYLEKCTLGENTYTEKTLSQEKKPTNLLENGEEVIAF